MAVQRRIIEREVQIGGRFVLATTAASYLEALNPEQRKAVEHGVTANGHVGTPLLVIAGAGSGKTNTLAHRVAHLIVS
ncbi:MAG: UvrD-helicase domain-containing protein, partial [Sinobacteraceae bacterium]|nr:UvrD-helicase domain-containing protein [Nevskiaceae bacterium]